jgi:N-methylhydantoinase A
MSRYRVTVDTGGTFSDFVYYNEELGEITITKIPSTPADPSDAIMQGMEALFAQGVPPAEVHYFCHGTTVGTNALLEGKGAVTGLLVTEGFRGIYEVMEQARPYGSAIFDVNYDKPAMLVPQSRTGEVAERIDFKGNILLPLDESALKETLKEWSGKGIESVAVCLLFSFLHPEHEQRVKEIIREVLPDSSVSLSSEVIPQIREYYRLSTTVINAYLQPILERYIRNLKAKFEQAQINTRQTYIMQSNGGTSTFEAAAKKAVATVLSGPAGGVTAGACLSETTGCRNLITFDMGGTSCDVALIKDGKPALFNRGKIENRDIAVPMMDINTVSAGGGTIARVDEMGILEVGPDSAGAVPGPACYRKGGGLPTVTDANLTLGYLSESNFLGGRMVLDKALAVQAIRDKVAQPLGLEPSDAAEGIIRIVNVKMEEAIKAISTARGYDLRDFMLVAFGGAGPLHGAKMARDLGMAGVIIPLYPGVYSAIGLLMSNVKHDYVQSKMNSLHQLTAEEVGGVLSKMGEQAKQELLQEGFTEDRIVMEYALDMRYTGQGYEISVPTKGELTPEELAELRGQFDQTHQQMFGHMAPHEPVEVVSYRVSGVGLVPRVDLPSYEPAGGTPQDAYRGERPVRFDGQDVSCPVYQREQLDVGLTLAGPAIIEQLDSTTVVNPGQVARIDEWKNIIIKEKE